MGNLTVGELAARSLIAEGRKHDEAMTPPPWEVDEEIAVIYGDTNNYDGVEVFCLGEEACNYEGDGRGIAWTRTHLNALLDGYSSALDEIGYLHAALHAAQAADAVHVRGTIRDAAIGILMQADLESDLNPIADALADRLADLRAGTAVHPSALSADDVRQLRHHIATYRNVAATSCSLIHRLISTHSSTPSAANRTSDTIHGKRSTP